MSPLYLEIVEGPGVGLKVPLRAPIVIGRGDGADLVLDNVHTSRAHARITPTAAAGAADHASVEDLGSANGTFVNHVAAHAPTRMSVGDELVVGVSVLILGSASDIDRRTTAMHSIPTVPPTAREPPPRPVTPPAFQARAKAAELPLRAAPVSELERLLDVNVKFRARMAPLAVLVLVALVVCVYLGAR